MASLASMNYRYRVFEARTARQVTTFTLKGTLDSCPDSVSKAPEPMYYRIVNNDALAAKLRPFITGTAR